jgi:hypothetical protein
MASSSKSGYQKEDKLLKVQRQADDVTNVMRQNIEKTMARGEQLDELDDKSLRLEESAQRFQKNANKVHWMFKCRSWRNMAIIIVLLAVVIVLILWAAGAFKQ